MSDFTKWPRLIVVGEPVTPEQANDILIRTNSWFLSSNDSDWVRQVAAAYGIPLDEHGAPDYRALQRVYAELGALQLHYLVNRQVMAAWLGGPHGWCDWTGRIGCSTWNIGKWPTEDAVTEDLVAIAAAFPYLSMHAQLISDEGEGDIVGTWAVLDGKAVPVEPAGFLTPPTELDPEAMIDAFMRPGRERGVSLGRLRQALAQVRAANRTGEVG